jgi:hypothetical protein
VIPVPENLDLDLENHDPYPESHDPNPENHFLEQKLAVTLKRIVLYQG